MDLNGNIPDLAGTNVLNQFNAPDIPKKFHESGEKRILQMEFQHCPDPLWNFPGCRREMEKENFRNGPGGIMGIPPCWIPSEISRGW